jgi:hypothetical protein
LLFWTALLKTILVMISYIAIPRAKHATTHMISDQPESLAMVSPKP